MSSSSSSNHQFSCRRSSGRPTKQRRVQDTVANVMHPMEALGRDEWKLRKKSVLDNFHHPLGNWAFFPKCLGSGREVKKYGTPGVHYAIDYMQLGEMATATPDYNLWPPLPRPRIGAQDTPHEAPHDPRAQQQQQQHDEDTTTSSSSSSSTPQISRRVTIVTPTNNNNNRPSLKDRLTSLEISTHGQKDGNLNSRLQELEECVWGPNDSNSNSTTPATKSLVSRVQAIESLMDRLDSLEISTHGKKDGTHSSRIRELEAYVWGTDYTPSTGQTSFWSRVTALEQELE
jgi:hypothetical protein